MVYYCGGFPPPYGGVTVKNELLFEMLKEALDDNEIEVLSTDGLGKKLRNTIRFLRKFTFTKGKFILAVSDKKRTALIWYMNFLGRNAMKDSIIIVMGGSYGDTLLKNKMLAKMTAQFKMAYVETKEMYNKFIQAGVRNVAIYPNCRKRPANEFSAENNNDVLQTVFFSRISRMKGVDTILSAAEEMNNCMFHFYGPIEEDYIDEFKAKVNSLSNVI